MVCPDSSRVSRVPLYLGTIDKREQYFRIRDYHPLRSRFPSCSSNMLFCNSWPTMHSRLQLPHNPAQTTNALLASMRFRLVPVRSPLLGESFLFLRVLRCFSSPSSPLTPMYSVQGNTPYDVLSFLIRTSVGHSSFGNSPQLFAAFHVLHRQ